MALLGGALAALADGAELSLGAALGLLAVFALAVSNGIMLVCHFQRLRSAEGEAFGPELIERGSANGSRRS